MPAFMTIDDEVINLDHVVRAQFAPREESIEEYFDEDTGQLKPKPARRARLTLTLTSLHLENSYDYEGNTKGTASTNDTMTIMGEHAEIAWAVLAGTLQLSTDK